VLAALPAVSALALGALYGLGVLLNVTQLLGEDVPVLDALPFIPLQDHLTKGLGSVFTSLPLFVFVFFTFFGVLVAVAFERVRKERLGTLKTSVDVATESLHEGPSAADFQALHDLREEVQSLAAETAALTKTSDTTLGETQQERFRRIEELSQRLQATEGVLEPLQAEAHQMVEATVVAQQHIDHAQVELDALTRSIRLRRLLDTTNTMRGIALFVFLLAPFMPWLTATGYAVIGLAVLAAPHVRVLRQSFVWPVLVTAAVVVPLLGNLYVYPAPLPRATIAIDNGVQRGALITSSGDRYVVARRGNGFIVIPSARVRSASITRPSTRSRNYGSLFNWLLG